MTTLLISKKGVHTKNIYDRSRMRDLSNQVYDRTLMILVNNVVVFFLVYVPHIFIFVYGTQSSHFGRIV